MVSSLRPKGRIRPSQFDCPAFRLQGRVAAFSRYPAEAARRRAVVQLFVHPAATLAQSCERSSFSQVLHTWFLGRKRAHGTFELRIRPRFRLDCAGRGPDFEKPEEELKLGL